MRLVWDRKKARSNLAKHGVEFATAAKVFDDPRVLSFPERSVDSELRWKAIGWAEGVPFILTVAHTVSEDGSEEAEEAEVIRIISARKATAGERREYEEGEW